MTEVTFERACAAVRDVLPRLTDILRTRPDPAAVAVGSWTLGDVAAHLSHVMDKDTAAVAQEPLPGIPLRPDAVAELTEEMLAADAERDPGALAGRLDQRAKAFVELAPPDRPVAWIGGIEIPASAVACHLLLETLVHGYDVATAAGMPWLIDPAHAALAITGGVVPIIRASPQSWISSRRDPSARARVQIRLRGHTRFVLDLGDTLSIEMPPGDRHCGTYVSADPGALLLIMLGRVSPIRALLHGKVLAWGRRPAAVFTLLDNLTPP